MGRPMQSAVGYSVISPQTHLLKGTAKQTSTVMYGLKYVL